MSNNRSYTGSKVVEIQPTLVHMFSAAGSAAQMHDSLQELVESVTHLNQMWHVDGANYEDFC